MQIQARDYMQSIFRSYISPDASSRTTPCTTLPPLSVGDWLVHPYQSLDGHEAEQLCMVPLWMVEPKENDVLTNNEGRGDDSVRYQQWTEQGLQAPPILLTQHISGKLKITDGHRRYYAAVRAGKTHILAWVSWLVWVNRPEHDMLMPTGSTIEWANEIREVMNG